MADSVFYAEHTWPEVDAKIAAGAPLFLPLGSTGQRGRHMTPNIDVLLPTGGSSAPRGGSAGWGCRRRPLATAGSPRPTSAPGFAGTLNLPAQPFSLVMHDVTCELFCREARRIVLLNGHYENIAPSIEGIELALDAIDRESAEGLVILRFDHWDMVRTETLQHCSPTGSPASSWNMPRCWKPR